MAARYGEDKVKTEYPLLRDFLIRRKRRLCRQHFGGLKDRFKGWIFLDLIYHDEEDMAKCTKCGHRLTWEYKVKDLNKGRVYCLGSECVHKVTGINREEVDSLKKIFRDVDQEVKAAEKVVTRYEDYPTYLQQRQISGHYKKAKEYDGQHGQQNRGFLGFVEGFIKTKTPLPAPVEIRVHELYEDNVGRLNRTAFKNKHPELVEDVTEIAKDNHRYKTTECKSEDVLFDMMDQIDARGELSNKQIEMFKILACTYRRNLVEYMGNMLRKAKKIDVSYSLIKEIEKLKEAAAEWGLDEEQRKKAEELDREIRAAE